MKVIYIYGDDDYGFLTFEGSEYNKPENLREIWDEAYEDDNMITTREIDDAVIYFDCYEFDDVDLDFIEFIRNKIQDYDDNKHKNFVVLEE